MRPANGLRRTLTSVTLKSRTNQNTAKNFHFCQHEPGFGGVLMICLQSKQQTLLWQMVVTYDKTMSDMHKLKIVQTLNYFAGGVKMIRKVITVKVMKEETSVD
jgi:hypothetical protein